MGWLHGPISSLLYGTRHSKPQSIFVSLGNHSEQPQFDRPMMLGIGYLC